MWVSFLDQPFLMVPKYGLKLEKTAKLNIAKINFSLHNILSPLVQIEGIEYHIFSSLAEVFMVKL